MNKWQLQDAKARFSELIDETLERTASHHLPRNNAHTYARSRQRAGRSESDRFAHRDHYAGADGTTDHYNQDRAAMNLPDGML
jgi:hypothetical protein